VRNTDDAQRAQKKRNSGQWLINLPDIVSVDEIVFVLALPAKTESFGPHLFLH